MKKLITKHKKFIFISLVMTALVSSAIFAWYIVDSKVSANALKVSVDSVNGLIVMMKVESNDASTTNKVLMDRINANGQYIDIGLARLSNIEDGKLAPGAFGEIHFYITSVSPYYNAYEIEIEPEYEYIEGIEDIKSIQNGVLTPVVTEDELTEIIDNHILYFTEKNVDSSTGRISYSGQLEYDSLNGRIALTKGDLVLNNEKEVVIYWYWPYDYNDIYRYLDADSSLSQNGSLDENIRSYDLEDTKIGNYLKSITLNFKVIGVQNAQ